MSLSAPSLEPGTVIAGRYRVETTLGSGAHGLVVRATEIDAHRQVALKILRPELVDSALAKARFRREARIAQQLEHAHTVRLFDFGETADGTCYMALELLDGEPLSALLDREGALPEARTARIAV